MLEKRRGSREGGNRRDDSMKAGRYVGVRKQVVRTRVEVTGREEVENDVEWNWKNRNNNMSKI